MSKPLRAYQERLVLEVSAAYKSGSMAVLMQSATGSGKTRTAAFIVDKYVSTSRQVLWLVHREELLMQASMVFAESGIRHSLICASSSEAAIKCQHVRELGKNFIGDRTLVLASIMTIVNRINCTPWLKPSQVVADECHLSLAESWKKVIRHYSKSRILGLTATPTRLDGKSFRKKDGGLYDEIVLGPEISELVEEGHLAKFKVYAPPLLLNDVQLRKSGGDYKAADLAQQIEGPKIYGDVIAHYEKFSKGKPAIAFCPTVESAAKYADAFCAAGYVAVSLDGGTDDAIRRESLKKLGRGEIDVVFSVSILIEGTDVPYATTAIWLRRTLSTVIWLQGNGRVLRPHKDKEYAIILDFVGNTELHGMPDEVRQWSLDGTVKRPQKEADIEAVKTRTCPNCFCVHSPAPLCPNMDYLGTGVPCGHRYETKARKAAKNVGGNLIEISQAMALKIAERKANAKQQGQARSLDDLIRLGKARGYKNPASWARNVFLARKK